MDDEGADDDAAWRCSTLPCVCVGRLGGGGVCVSRRHLRRHHWGLTDGVPVLPRRSSRAVDDAVWKLSMSTTDDGAARRLWAMMLRRVPVAAWTALWGEQVVHRFQRICFHGARHMRRRVSPWRRGRTTPLPSVGRGGETHSAQTPPRLALLQALEDAVERYAPPPSCRRRRARKHRLLRHDEGCGVPRNQDDFAVVSVPSIQSV